jgi:membrane protease YdiL (CAAX protease family)
MIRNPLVRFGLFVVAVVLWYSVLGPFGHSFNSSLLWNAAAVFAATAMMVALDLRGPGFIGLSLDAGWWRQALAGFALGWASIVAAALPMLAAGSLQWTATAFDARRWLLMAVLFLIAAAAEELLFRGYGFQRMVEGVGPVPALLVLAVFFAFAHFFNPNRSWPGLVNTVLVGLVFGVAYLRTGRLWLPIGWHWGWNLAEASLGFPVSGIRMEGMPVQAEVSGRQWLTGVEYGPEGSLPVTLVLLVSLILLLRFRPTHGKAVQENES